ncbi:protein of unknown function [Thermococcus nautili]|nr:protein of unknown function [Thermococcus nautili]
MAKEQYSPGARTECGPQVTPDA